MAIRKLRITCTHECESIYTRLRWPSMPLSTGEGRKMMGKVNGYPMVHQLETRDPERRPSGIGVTCSPHGRRVVSSNLQAKSFTFCLDKSIRLTQSPFWAPPRNFVSLSITSHLKKNREGNASNK